MLKTRKNGTAGIVQSVTYPTTAPTRKPIQCRHCPAKFENKRGHAVHRGMSHPLVNAHGGTRLLKSMRGVGKVAMWPWEGLGMGRCGVARLGTGPEETTMFQLQPKRLSFNDGFSCDNDKPAGRYGAGMRRVYTNREKAAAVEKLRRYQMQEHAIFIAYIMTPPQFTPKTIDTVESNKGEAQSVEKAAVDEELPTEGLVSKSGERGVRSVPRQAQERAQGVHPLALCHHDQPYQEALPRQPSGRNVHPDLALCRKVGEEVPRRHKAEEKLERGRCGGCKCGLHRRGQANLGEKGRGVQVERGMRTTTRSTADFLWTEGLTWTRCVKE